MILFRVFLSLSKMSVDNFANRGLVILLVSLPFILLGCGIVSIYFVFTAFFLNVHLPMYNIVSPNHFCGVSHAAKTKFSFRYFNKDRYRDQSECNEYQLSLSLKSEKYFGNSRPEKWLYLKSSDTLIYKTSSGQIEEIKLSPDACQIMNNPPLKNIRKSLASFHLET
jgi:hypothetical protein